jgi:hypothetical protein
MVTPASAGSTNEPHLQENSMSTTMEYGKMNKVIRIFGVVQLGLVALLVYMAVNFQEKLRMVGREYRFMHGVVASFVVQLIILYPMFKFAEKEAQRDLALTRNPTRDQAKVLAKQKRMADILKISGLGFFVIFIMAAPGDPFILSVIYYSFILTILTYLQCYNFAARKLVHDDQA